MRDFLLTVFDGPGRWPEPGAPRNVWPAPASTGEPLRSAAVLVPLIERERGMTVLLTQRTATLSAHAGQISFPGGQLQSGDRSPEDTALRETEEEIGVPPGQIELIGRLNAHETGTGFHVVPVVGLLRPPFPIAVDPSEVDHVFEVPLDFVLDPANQKYETRMHRGALREFCVLPWDEYYIWGLTARVLFELSRVVRQA